VDLAASLGLDPVAEAGDGDRVIPTVANPIRLSSTPASYELAPPTLGESTEAVKDWLRSVDPLDRWSSLAPVCCHRWCRGRARCGLVAGWAAVKFVEKNPEPRWTTSRPRARLDHIRR